MSALQLPNEIKFVTRVFSVFCNSTHARHKKHTVLVAIAQYRRRNYRLSTDISACSYVPVVIDHLSGIEGSFSRSVVCVWQVRFDWLLPIQFSSAKFYWQQRTQIKQVAKVGSCLANMQRTRNGNEQANQVRFFCLKNYVRDRIVAP